MKICDMPEFDKLLIAAEKNIGNEWEARFMYEIRQRYEIYGDNTYMSEKQAEILKRIAGS